MIWAMEPERTESLSLLAQALDCTVKPWNPRDPSYYVLIDLCSKTEMLDDFLSELVRYLEQHRSVAVVWTSFEELETAYILLSEETDARVDDYLASISDRLAQII